MKDNVVKIKEGEAFITLNVLLKLTGEISTGGQAKIFLQTNNVKVNGADENRRGRKLYPNDEVEVNKNKYLVTI